MWPIIGCPRNASFLAMQQTLLRTTLPRYDVGDTNIGPEKGMAHALLRCLLLPSVVLVANSSFFELVLTAHLRRCCLRRRELYKACSGIKYIVVAPVGVTSMSLSFPSGIINDARIWMLGCLLKTCPAPVGFGTSSPRLCIIGR